MSFLSDGAMGLTGAVVPLEFSLKTQTERAQYNPPENGIWR